jgi:hypothetical protein
VLGLEGAFPAPLDGGILGFGHGRSGGGILKLLRGLELGGDARVLGL